MTPNEVRQVINWNGYDLYEGSGEWDGYDNMIPILTDEGLMHANFWEVERWWKEWNERVDKRQSMWRISTQTP
jgi:hypothetical protein